jgi:uncharacterized protein (TIGR02145 family)
MGITIAEDATPKEAQIAARKKLAPIGWHVPSDREWSILTTFLGQEAPTGHIGRKVKDAGTAHWISPNGGVSNSSGFTGLPGGNRYDNGMFNDIGNNGNWWSSTENNTTNAWNRNLNYNNGNVNRCYYDKASGFSVRCLWD